MERRLVQTHELIADALDAPELRLSGLEARAVADALGQISEATEWRPTGPAWTISTAALIIAGVYWGKISKLRAQRARSAAQQRADTGAGTTAARPQAQPQPARGVPPAPAPAAAGGGGPTPPPGWPAGPPAPGRNGRLRDLAPIVTEIDAGELGGVAGMGIAGMPVTTLAERLDLP
jgi:hypothetical protein